MRCFDVYRNESPRTGRRFPYFLVVQSELLTQLSTCVVIPVGLASVLAGHLAKSLTPELQVEGKRYVMYTPEIGAVPGAVLRKHITNLENQSDIILRALDFLFSGI